jgi:hypothetical protein
MAHLLYSSGDCGGFNSSNCRGVLACWLMVWLLLALLLPVRAAA